MTKGGRVDFTADQEDEGASHDALMDWSKRVGNVALRGVSLSSDAFGSLPKFDSKGELVDYTVASPKANLNTMRRLVQDGKWALEDALQLSTTNPASFLSFKSKGNTTLSAWIECRRDLLLPFQMGLCNYKLNKVLTSVNNIFQQASKYYLLHTLRESCV